MPDSLERKAKKFFACYIKVTYTKNPFAIILKRLTVQIGLNL